VANCSAEIKYAVFVSAQIEELQLTCQVGSVNCTDETEIAVKPTGELVLHSEEQQEFGAE